MAQNAREVALKILYEIDKNQAYSNISLNRNLEASELTGADRALVTELTYGSIKWKGRLDYIISQYSKVKPNKISPWIVNILRLGIYQLMFMDRIPVSAACNESVKLARKYGHSASSGFVNAVLRKVSTTGDQITYPDKVKEPAKYLSVYYSHPQWMVDRWMNNYGFEFTEALLAKNNQTPELVIRTNILKETTEGLADKLKAEGIEVQNSKYVPEALILKNSSSISSLKAFKEGLFQVQDESSMLVSYVVDPKEGNLVIDVCSAPGGKTTHMAEKMKNKGKILALDVHSHKLDLVEDSAKRLGIKIIETKEQDARIPLKEMFNKADRVLVDAPCTGLGIIRKKPDIKWARREEDIKGIVSLQKGILKSASKCVKPGGVLVYSTCTIEKEENIEVIKDFLTENTNFFMEDVKDFLPEEIKYYASKEGTLEMYPNVHGVDGFFICRMKRKG